SIDRLGDYAIVYLNGKEVGRIDRRLGQNSLTADFGAFDQLGILVESLARVNFGPLLPTERKGIDGLVNLDGLPLENWYQNTFPLEEPPHVHRTRNPGPVGPMVYNGSLKVDAPADTFLD